MGHIFTAAVLLLQLSRKHTHDCLLKSLACVDRRIRASFGGFRAAAASLLINRNMFLKSIIICNRPGRPTRCGINSRRLQFSSRRGFQHILTRSNTLLSHRKIMVVTSEKEVEMQYCYRISDFYVAPCFSDLKKYTAPCPRLKLEVLAIMACVYAPSP